MKERLEYKDAKSNKFWEITTIQNTNGIYDVVVAYGKIGTTGKSKVVITRMYEASAKRVAKDLINKKLKKGYVVVKNAKGPRGANSASLSGQALTLTPLPLREAEKSELKAVADNVAEQLHNKNIPVKYSGEVIVTIIVENEIIQGKYQFQGKP